MSKRVLVIPNLMSAPEKWKYESGLLLPLKMAAALSRRGDIHTHIAVPGAVTFAPRMPRVTLHELPRLTPKSTVMNFGDVVSPSAMLELISKIGPDLLIVASSSIATVVSTLLDGDRLQRSGKVSIPLVMWDIIPEATDIIERHAGQSSSHNVSAGMLLASDVWFCGGSTRQASLTEIRKWYGFSAEERVRSQARMLNAVIDIGYMRQAIGDNLPKRRDKFTVHIGGRWSKTKNYEMVCNAVMKLKAQGEDIELLWTGPVDRGIDKWVAEMGVTTLSGLTQEEMWREASSCHVGVLAQDPQALPCLPFEQMAVGLPVLVRSTEHTSEVMPGYPLVFDGEGELIALLGDMMRHYDERRDASLEWFDQNVGLYDMAAVGDLVDEVVEREEQYIVNVSVDADGDLSMAVSKGMMLFHHSMLRQSVMRKSALAGGLIENIDLPIPKFSKSEEAKEEVDA